MYMEWYQQEAGLKQARAMFYQLTSTISSINSSGLRQRILHFTTGFLNSIYHTVIKKNIFQEKWYLFLSSPSQMVYQLVSSYQNVSYLKYLTMDKVQKPWVLGITKKTIFR